MRMVIASLAFTVLLAGCQPTCQSTCVHFYSDEECGAGPEGKATEDAIQECLTICQDALNVPGPAIDPGDRRYNPELPAPLEQSHTLSTEQEAAAWMDCVWSFPDDECHDRLDAQYCVKIF